MIKRYCFFILVLSFILPFKMGSFGSVWAEETSLLVAKVSKKIQKTYIKRDRSFKVPKSQTKVKKKKRLNLRDVQPPATTRLYQNVGSDEAELEEVINEEINQLFKLLKQERNADLTLRLGSLYVDKSRLISFKLQSDYDQKMEDFKAGERKTKPHLNLKSAKVYNRKSLKLFKDFRDSYPKHRRMDEVLFFLGFNFYQLEDEKEGIKYFSELESRFPKSPYLYEARFQLGEHYFQLRQWNNSFKYYKKVSQNKRGKFYFFALYKMAWSSYKMNKVERGLKLLEKILKEGQTLQTNNRETFNFNAEATEDLVLFYTYSKRSAEQARSFFLSLLDEEQAWKHLKRLAYTYRDTGQVKKVLVLFGDLIENDPVGESAFEYKYQIVETMYNFGKVSQIIKSMNEWVRNYGPNSSWAQANRGHRSLLEKSFKLQEVTVKNYSLKSHEIFRRTKSQRAKTLALAFYKIYFDHFEKSDSFAQMRFFYGELLFDSKKYISAVKSYEEVISDFPNSKYAKPAYVNQILALEKALPTSDEIIQLTQSSNEEPIELTNEIKSFMKVSLRYVEKFPQEKNTPSILYRMAALYYKFNQFSQAAKYFKKLSDEHPSSKLVSNVGGILLDIYNKNKDFESLEKLALQLQQNKNVDKELLTEVNFILEQLSFKRAQDLAVKKQYKQSAELYEKFAKANPGSSLAPEAFYNAGLNYKENGNYLLAIAMYSSALAYKSKTHNKARKYSQESLAILYEKLGFYKKAAQAYVTYAKKYPLDSKVPDFWYNAGVIFDALNDIPSAVFSYKKHLVLSKKSDRYEVFYLIGLMYEKNQKWKLAIANYDQYLKTPTSNKLRVVQASANVARIYEKKLRNLTQAEVWHKKTLGLYRRLKTGLTYGARSHFYITKALYKNFSKVKIPSQAQAQKVAVDKKLKLLKNLEKALKPVIRYDDGEQIIASLALIGQAYQDMARAFYQAPIPKGLGRKGRAQYREGIKKLISPYIAQAVKNYRTALKKAEEFQVYSEGIEQAYKGLFSLILKEGQFEKFGHIPVLQEILPLQVIDPTGTVTEGFLKTLRTGLKYGVSKEEFETLSRAIASRSEKRVLTAVSEILDKDPDNIPAINSLALFYLKNRRPGLGALILNRVTDKKTNDPVIMNNLAMVSLKYGQISEAIVYLKKALKADSSYAIARVNLAQLFLQSYNYRSAYINYKDNYSEVVKMWPSRDSKTIALLSNYAVALTGAKEWGPGRFVFKNLTKRSSPRAEVLFNYSIFLMERSKEEEGPEAKASLAQAKGLLDELNLSPISAGLKRKVRLLSRQIGAKIKK